MDGVLVDFHRGFLALSGLDYTTMSSNAFWREAVKHQDMYKDLPKMEDADDLIAALEIFGMFDSFDIEILTALPSLAQFPNAEQHKREWIEKHFPLGWKFKVGPFAVDKQLHAKPGDILIDDKLRNIDQWTNAGGIGIHHISAQDTILRLAEVLHDGV